MIRPLNDADRELTLEFLGSEPEQNLFMLGDIENFGMQTEFQRTWGDFDPEDGLRAVLIWFNHLLMFYAPGSCDLPALLELINTLEYGKFLGGAVSVAPIAAALPFKKNQLCTLARLDRADSIDTVPSLKGLRRLAAHDVERIMTLRAQIPEFGPISADSVRRQLEAGHARGYWIERDGAMVSLAQTTAECSLGAMIVGVCSLPEWRGRGYAGSLTSLVCRDVLAEGKFICLFYDNPVAAGIYKKMGFKECGKYTMLER